MPGKFQHILISGTITAELPLSFIDLERGGFGEILPEVMISLLRVIFRRIPQAEGL